MLLEVYYYIAISGLGVSRKWTYKSTRYRAYTYTKSPSCGVLIYYTHDNARFIFQVKLLHTLLYDIVLYKFLWEIEIRYERVLFYLIFI